ncbi:MAG: two-component system cell cycle sensor histidine kinase/response regulator CckA [Candidatus Paceibacteria bacterium]|jgi:nitrogen-specific signal transduction histidine kinase
MHAGAQLILDVGGVPVRMIGAHLDRAGPKNAEKQALQSQRLESLGTLARGVAHDLNNALAPIRMSVDLQKLMHGTFAKNIDQRVECEPALPVVLGDATQVHQVLLNLCVNRILAAIDGADGLS